MILSAKAIQAEIALGRLRVDPTPDVTTRYDTDSVNVHMGDSLYEWRPHPQGMSRACASKASSIASWSATHRGSQDSRMTGEINAGPRP